VTCRQDDACSFEDAVKFAVSSRRTPDWWRTIKVLLDHGASWSTTLISPEAIGGYSDRPTREGKSRNTEHAPWMRSRMRHTIEEACLAGTKVDGRGGAKRSLAGFGVRPRALTVWSAFYTGRILKGERAAELAVPQSRASHQLRIAKALGVKCHWRSSRADEAID
jgi:hypothetical protein